MRVAVGVAILATFLLVPTVDWLDGGTLVAAAWSLGVAHPPGEVPWLQWARWAQQLPAGDLAFRAALVSAVALGVVGASLAGGGRESGRRGWPASVLVLAAVTSPLALLQATRAEVYAPVGALLLLAWTAVAPGTGPRHHALGGLAFGLAAAVHPLLAAAALPGIAWRAGIRALPWALIGALAPLPMLAWLPLRALARPDLAWGVPDAPGPFLDVLLARGFAQNFGTGGTDWIENSRVVALFALHGGLPLLVVVVLLSAWAPGERSERPAGVVAAGLWSLGAAATQWTQNKVYVTNPDAAGYLWTGLLPWWSLAIAAAPRLASAPPPARQLAQAAALVLLLQSFTGGPTVRPSSFAALTWARGLLGLPVPGGLTVLSGNDGAFLSTWSRVVEGWGPGTLVVPRVLLGHRHEAARLREPLAVRGVPWTPLLRERPLEALHGWPALRLEARAPELQAGPVVRVGLLVAPAPDGAELPAEGPFASWLRGRVLDELASASLRDPEASLVRAWWLENGGRP